MTWRGLSKQYRVERKEEQFILGMVRASWAHMPECVARRILPWIMRNCYNIPEEEIEICPEPMKEWRRHLDEITERSAAYITGRITFYGLTAAAVGFLIYDLVK